MNIRTTKKYIKKHNCFIESKYKFNNKTLIGSTLSLSDSVRTNKFGVILSDLFGRPVQSIGFESITALTRCKRLA
jgi:hypothetical protein